MTLNASSICIAFVKQLDINIETKPQLMTPSAMFFQLNNTYVVQCYYYL